VEVAPGAQANVTCQLTYQQGTTSVERVEVELTGAQVTFRSLPYPFTQVRGTVTYEPGLLTLERLRGERAGGWLEVRRGLIDNLEHEPSFELKLFAQKLPLDEALRGLLSPGLQELWDKLAPSGTISFPKDAFSISGGPTWADERVVRVVTYQGDVDLEDVGFTLGFEFRQANGRISLGGQILLDREGADASATTVELTSPDGSPLPSPSASSESSAGGSMDPGARPRRLGAPGAPPAAAGRDGATGAPAGWQVISHSYQGTARLTGLVASGKPLKDLTGSFVKEGAMLGFSSVRAKMYDGELTGAAHG
jgi:hypothetical protein